MNAYIIHKIALYINIPSHVKLFFNIKEYHNLINCSNFHFDELYDLYGNTSYNKVHDLRSLQAMLRLGIPYNTTHNYYPTLMDCMASNNHLELVKWLHQNNHNDATTDAMDYAAVHGHLEMIKLLHQLKIKGSRKTMDNAAKYGHLNIVQWLYENRLNDLIEYPNLGICTNHAFDAAASFNHIDIVKYLHQNNITSPTTNAFDYAAENGHLDMLKWLYYNNSKKQLCTNNAFDEAAKNGHLEIVKWLHIHLKRIDVSPNDMSISICTYSAVDWAAENGHLEMVKWLLTNRTEGYQYAVDLAAREGHLDIIKWIYYNCKDDFKVFRAIDLAAGATTNITFTKINRFYCEDELLYLDIIKFLYSVSGSKSFTTDAVDYAAANNCFEIVEWFILNRSELLVNSITPYICTNYAFDWSAKNNNLEMMKWLFEHRADHLSFTLCSNAAINLAASNGHLEVIKWLQERIVSSRANPNDENKSDLINYGIDSNAFDVGVINGITSAVMYNQLHVLKFLHQNYKDNPMIISDEIIIHLGKLAAERGYLDILKYLNENNLFFLDQEMFIKANKYGHLDVLKWLYQIYNQNDRENYINLDILILIKDAIFFNNLSIIKWFFANEPTFFTFDLIDFANNYDPSIQRSAIITFLSKNIS